MTIAILSNDTAPSGTLNPASVLIETPPNNGSVQILASGAIRYVPSNNFAGTDTLRYSVQDSLGQRSNAANVTVQVTTALPLCDGDGVLPECYIVSLTPSGNSVSLDTTTLTVRFNQPMSISGGGRVTDPNRYSLFQTADPGREIPITAAVYNAQTYSVMLTLNTADADWRSGTAYTLRVNPAIQNAAGTPQGQPVTIPFQTVMVGGACTAPLGVDGTLADGFVQAVTPADDLTGVSLGLTTITVQFTQPMRLDGGGRVTDPANYDLYWEGQSSRRIAIANVTYNAAAQTATLTLNTADLDWRSGRWYTLVIENGLNNECGTPQGADVFTRFQTQIVANACTAPQSPNGSLPDGFVASISPANNAVNVPITTSVITLTFTQPLAMGGGGQATSLSHYDLALASDSDNFVSVTALTYDPTTQTVSYGIDINDEDWRGGTEYLFRVRSSLQNECGTQQNNDIELRFTTETFGTCSNPGSFNGVLPDGFVQSVIPADDAVNVSLGTNTITIQLNQPMTPGSGSEGVINPSQYRLYRQGQPGAQIPITGLVYDQVSYTVTLTIDTTDPDWGSNRLYELEIGKDISNQCQVSQDEYVYTQFRTENPPNTCTNPLAVDGTLPDGFVSGVTPAPEAVAVPLTMDQLVVQFNQPMQQTGGGRVTDLSRYRLHQDAGPEVTLTGAVYNAGTRTLTLTVDTTDPDWQPGTLYWLELRSQIRNECDTQQGASVYSRFTTNTPPTAADLSVTTQYETPVIIDVASSASDPDTPIAPLSTAILWQPNAGTAQVLADGTIQYTPAPGFSGADFFAYTISDSAGAAAALARIDIFVAAQGQILSVIPQEDPIMPTTEPTPEPTFTPSAPFTPSATVTFTPSPTFTPSITPTLEPTLTPSETPTPEPTFTPSMTLTAEPTFTPSETPTPEPTFTPSETPTPEPTFTPSITPTPEPMLTPSETPTAEPTLTPSITPTPEPIPTPTSPPPGKRR